MKYYLIVFVWIASSLGMFTSSAIGQTFSKTGGANPLTLFESKIYSAEKLAIKDLVFKVKIEGLEELLNKTQHYGKIKNLEMLVYWTPKEQAIEIKGVPESFGPLIDQLKIAVESRLPLALANKYSKPFEKFQKTIVKETTGQKLDFIDPTGQSFITKGIFKFDLEGVLKSYKQFSLVGPKDVEYAYKIEPWSRGSYVLISEKTKVNDPLQLGTTVHSLTYKATGGFYMVERIKSVVTYAEAGQKQQKQQKNEFNAVFSEYKINTTEALKFFAQKRKQ